MSRLIPAVVDLDTVRIDPAWALRISSALALRRLALPLCRIDGELVVALADVNDQTTCDMITRTCEVPVRTVKADAAQLRKYLLQVYGDTRSSGQTSSKAGGGSDDAMALADNLLRAAMLRMASDIHLDPTREGLRVRLRVDGVLEDFMNLPTTVQSALCSRFKVMAGMDIAERRAPQDGAFTWSMSGGRGLEECDVRAATLPVRFGEKITLRLLEASRQGLELSSLGLSNDDLACFKRVLARPHGLVLLTGPTGSGKTTTLYAGIQHLLEHNSLNILTVEDPVEYEIKGISQVEVESSDKVNFGKALRSLLRHDPDVVMIGEIRDSESLDTAVKAALTGHLVLSTLHTNDAMSAVTRLVDMRLPPHMIAATLRMSAAQRLVRKLCPQCREPYSLSKSDAMALYSRSSLEGEQAFRSSGCLACAGRGFSGRTGVFELLIPDAEFASLIAAGASVVELAAAMRAKGINSLADDAVRKVLAGETAVEEVVKIATDV